MRIDYSNRRQVSVNRPKRSPFRPFLFLTLLGGAIVLGLGVATGWLLFSHGKQTVTSPSQTGVATGTAAAQTAKTTPPLKPQSGSETPHLTFYDSLPKGDKELIGSGLNPTKDNTPRQPSAVDVQSKTTPNSQKPVSTQPAVDNNSRSSASETSPAVVNKGAATGKSVLSPQKTAGNTANYTVQLASYHDKKEAEELKAKLAKNGYSVRIVESSAPGKGTLYRVRIGNRMSQEAASQLSVKIGSGAIAVPEQGKNDGKAEKR